MTDPTTYLAKILVPERQTPEPGPSHATDTLRALRELGGEPTVGAIALRAGLSYVQTQRDLVWLVSQAQAVEVEKVKADGYQLRYRVTP